MPSIRLYCPQTLTTAADIVLGGDQARYVGKVLRRGPGDFLRVFDGQGGEFDARIASLGKNELTLRLGQRLEYDVESPYRIHLLQCVSRGQRMDFVLQKATELGVSRITPLISQFSVVRLSGERASNRTTHWQKIAISACEQCGRNTLPTVDAPTGMTDWLQSNQQRDEQRYVLAPGANQKLAAVTSMQNSVTILIGPEGGLADEELEQLEVNGFRAVSLGPRILRTETAALAAVTALQLLNGDLA